MKTTKAFLLLLACIGLLFSCDTKVVPSSEEYLDDDSTLNWQVILPGLDLASGMILVEKEGSIQEGP